MTHKDKREGVVFFGADPDHYTPMMVINKWLGEDVLELNGNGMGVHLFLPESKLDKWQKIALNDAVWGAEDKVGGMVETSINLELLEK